MSRAKLPLEGKRFGRLIVISFAGLTKRQASTWKCQCDCGEITICTGQHLVRGGTKSCGCLRREEKFVHGMCGTPFRDIWRNLLNRCYNKKDSDYKNYGGRGIAACAFIRSTPSNLFSLMGNRPTPKMTLDRANNDLGYTCGECDECLTRGWKMNLRWATRSQQNSNKRYLGRKRKP